MRKVFLVTCAATALVLPVVAVTGQAGSTPARAPAPARPIQPVPPAEPAAAPVVSPTLTDVPLGNAGVPAGRQVSTGEPDAPPVRLSPRELTVRRPVTGRFSAVGVTWATNKAVGAVRVELRHRLGQGRWSAWSIIEPGDVAPDPADVAARPDSRAGTDPVWTGPSTGVEARVTPISGVPPSDVRLTLVDPGESAADTAPEPTVGTLAVGRPAIYGRAQWGADPRLMGWTPEYSRSLKAGFLHHTAGTNSYTSAQVPAILRSIYAFHARTRGWGDIGYNFLVDRFGRIWEGRYGGVDSTVIGAHSGGFNANTFGVSMIGTYETTAVPAATVNAVSAVFAWKLARWNLNPYGTARLTSSGGGTSRYRAGTTVTKNVISGHRDVGNTSCPGSRGYAALPTIRRQAAARIAAGGGGGAPPGPARLVSPSVSPTSVAYGAAAGPRVTAGLTGSRAWTVTVARDCPARPVKRWSGSGTRVDTSWDLRDSTGAWVRPGAYTLTVTPTGDGSGAGHTVRLAVLPPTGAPPLATGALPRPGPAGFVPVAPVRVLDTRSTLGGAGSLPLGGARRVDVPVLGAGGVPDSGVAAVLVSLTGFCATTDTPLTLWPAGTAKPLTTAVSVARAATGTFAGLAAVRVGAGGRISVAAGPGSTEAALDVVGYLPLSGGVAFHPVPGTRAVDLTLAPGETREVRVAGGPVPARAAAVLANAAVITPSSSGHLRLWRVGQPRPGPANLSFAAGPTSSDRTVVPLVGGEVAMHNDSAAPLRVVLDLSGWYGGAAGSRFTATGPTRIPAGTLRAGRDNAVPVAGRAGLPRSGATAVVASLSVRSGARTWLAAWGSGPRPPTADLHAEANRWQSTLVVLPVGPDGAVRLYHTAGDARTVLDVVGYYR